MYKRNKKTYWNMYMASWNISVILYLVNTK